MSEDKNSISLNTKLGTKYKSSSDSEDSEESSVAPATCITYAHHLKNERSRGIAKRRQEERQRELQVLNQKKQEEETERLRLLAIARARPFPKKDFKVILEENQRAQARAEATGCDSEQFLNPYHPYTVVQLITDRNENPEEYEKEKKYRYEEWLKKKTTELGKLWKEEREKRNKTNTEPTVLQYSPTVTINQIEKNQVHNNYKKRSASYPPDKTSTYICPFQNDAQYLEYLNKKIKKESEEY
jgi:hypothetical protein